MFFSPLFSTCFLHYYISFSNLFWIVILELRVFRKQPLYLHKVGVRLCTRYPPHTPLVGLHWVCCCSSQLMPFGFYVVTCGASFTEFFKAFVWVLYHDGGILSCCFGFLLKKSGNFQSKRKSYLNKRNLIVSRKQFQGEMWIFLVKLHMNWLTIIQFISSVDLCQWSQRCIYSFLYTLYYTHSSYDCQV